MDKVVSLWLDDYRRSLLIIAVDIHKHPEDLLPWAEIVCIDSMEFFFGKGSR